MNLDIWRIISFNLPFNSLNLNKELSSIYNLSWFKDKLLVQYPGFINKHNNSWEWLYKRSLKSGKIFKYNENKNTTKQICLINAIKISEINPKWDLFLEEDFNYYKVNIVLTFDGDLYTFHRSKNYISDLTLIDTNVIDIDDNTYIKNNKWYLFPERINDKITEKIVVLSNYSNFLGVSSEDNYICAITKDTFYCYNLYTERETQRLKIHNCLNNVNLIFSGNFIIQKSDDSLIKYDHQYDTSTKLEIGTVKNIYPGSIKLLDNSLIVLSKYHSPLLKNELSFYNISNEKNTFNNSIFNCGIPFLLIDNNVYSTKNMIKNNDKNLLLIYENVKNICGRYEIYFII